MSDTTIPIPAQIDPPMAQAAPSISVGDIKVEGNITGNIVVGNGNVIGDRNVVYQVHNYHGAIVKWHEAPPISPRDIKPLAPREPRGFVGREDELKTLEEKIRNKQALVLYGLDGLGKTALLKKVANSAEAKAMPDGVFYAEKMYEGDEPGLQDILQRLFDQLFESNPPRKVTDAIAALHLQHTSPLIILDQTGLPPTSLNRLPDMFPGGAVLVAEQTALFVDVFESIEAGPLHREEAIQLFLLKSGLDPDASARQSIDQICELLEDVPLAITTVANAIRRYQFSIDTLVDHLTRINTRFNDPIQAAIERSFLMLYFNPSEPEEFNDPSAQKQLPLAAVANALGRSVDRQWLESQWEGAQGTVKELEDLELLYANSPRLRMPEGIRGFHHAQISDMEQWRTALVHRYLDDFEHRLLDSDFVNAELGNILGVLHAAFENELWSAVVKLGQAVDPYLTLHGLWDAWAKVLNQVLVAGQQLNDLAIVGWALHQLGTREIGVGTRAPAIRLLRQALRIRLSLGDLAGVAYTLHNLRIILIPHSNNDEPKNPDELLRRLYSDDGWFQPPPTPPHPSPWWQRLWNTMTGIVTAAFAGVFLQSPLRSWWEKTWDAVRAAAEKLSDTLSGMGDAIVARLPWRPSMPFWWNRVPGISRLGAWVIPAVIATILLAAVLVQPALSLRVQADPTQYNPVGQVIQYSYVVDNSRLRRVSGPIFVEAGDTTRVICPDVKSIGNGDEFLDWNERLTCTGLYTITQEDVASREVKNTARAVTAIRNENPIQSRPRTVSIRFDPRYLDLSLEANQKTYKNPNETISYTYTAKNTGSGVLQGAYRIANDGEALPVQCPEVNTFGNFDSAIDLGETIICSGTYTITAEDIKNGSVTTTVWVSVGDFNSERQSLTIFRETSPGSALSLSKSAEPKIYTSVGQQIKYRYTVALTGAEHLPGPITVSDENIDVHCQDVGQVGNLDNWLDLDETLTCDAIYVVTQTDIDRRTVTHTARASAGDVSATSQSITIYYETAPPSLGVVAKPATYEQPGQQIDYTYSIRIDGDQPLAGPVTVSDGKLKVTCPDLHQVGNQDAALDRGETLICTAAYEIAEEDVKNGFVTNTAWVTAGNLTSELQSVTIYASLSPSILHLTTSANPKTYQKAGEPIQYTYYIQNEGKGPLKGPVLVEDGEIEVRCQNLEEAGDLDAIFDPGEVLTCAGTYVITADDLKNGFVTNVASASAETVLSNRDASTVHAKALRLSVSADREEFQAANEQIRYKYSITSFSKQPLYDPIHVTDDRVQVTCPEFDTIGNLDDFFDWGETIACEGEYTAMQADIDQIQGETGRGTVTTTAWASAGDVLSESVSLTVLAPRPEPKLSLANTPSLTAYDTVDQTITYTYAITNDGNVTLSMPFQITDERIESNVPFRCETDLQQLAPGESVTCTNIKTYRISQADFKFGNSFVTSNASVTGSFLKTPVISAPLSTTVACTYPPQGWIAYTVQSGETLPIIRAWYPNLTLANLQKTNCMGSLPDISVGQTLYVPEPPPLANLTGVIRDSTGRGVSEMTVILYDTDGIIVRSQTTAGNGTYSFLDLEPGTYRIFDAVVDLVRGETSTQDFEIRSVTP